MAWKEPPGAGRQTNEGPEAARVSIGGKKSNSGGKVAERKGGAKGAKGANFGGLKIDEGEQESSIGGEAGGGPKSLPGSGFTFGAGMGSHLEGPDEDVGGAGDQAHYGPYTEREGRMSHPVWHKDTLKGEK